MASQDDQSGSAVRATNQILYSAIQRRCRRLEVRLGKSERSEVSVATDRPKWNEHFPISLDDVIARLRRMAGATTHGDEGEIQIRVDQNPDLHRVRFTVSRAEPHAVSLYFSYGDERTS
jgi:hypothetical protein